MQQELCSRHYMPICQTFDKLWPVDVSPVDFMIAEAVVPSVRGQDSVRSRVVTGGCFQ